MASKQFRGGECEFCGLKANDERLEEPNIQEAMDIIAKLRATLPHNSDGDRGAVILGSAWLHLAGQHRFFNLSGLATDDSGALALPYALLGIAGYMVYWMISHGIFHALTALQAGR